MSCVPRVPVWACVAVLAGALVGLRLSASRLFGDGAYLRHRVLLLSRIRDFVRQWEPVCVAEVQRCCADVHGEFVDVMARHMGRRAARQLATVWRAAVAVPAPPSASPPVVFFGIAPSFAFSADVGLGEMLELVHVADGVLRLAEDRRWLDRCVTLLQYVLLRRLSLMEEAALYRRLLARARLSSHRPASAPRAPWAAAWRLHRRPTWLAPLQGGRECLCLPLSYFPLEAVLPYMAGETWLSERLLTTQMPRWTRFCVRALERRCLTTSRPASAAPEHRMPLLVHYWFLRYTAPLARAVVRQQRDAASAFSVAQLCALAGCGSNDAASSPPRGPWALLWRCCRAWPTQGPAPSARAARRLLVLRAASQAVVEALRVCCPGLSVRYVTELAMEGYGAHRRAEDGAGTAADADTLLRAMALDMAKAVVAGVAEVLLLRFAGTSGHQLAQMLADTATRRLEGELLAVDEAFFLRWLRAPAVGAGLDGWSAPRSAPASVAGMRSARPPLTAEDVLAVGRRGGERVLGFHDAVVRRSLRYGVLLLHAAATREWRPLMAAAATAWVSVPTLLAAVSVAVGYSAPADVARLLSGKEEGLPARSPAGLRLLLELLVEDEARGGGAVGVVLQRPYLALVVCSGVSAFEHVWTHTQWSAHELDAHVRGLQRLYEAVATRAYIATAAPSLSACAADAITAMQEDVRCTLYFAVHHLQHSCRRGRDGDGDGGDGSGGGVARAAPHPLLDPEEALLLQQPDALAYLPSHVDYFDLFSLPYRTVLRHLGLEMVFAYRTAAGMQQESQQVAEAWWTQALFHSTFNPLTAALLEAVQLATSCATVLLLCLGCVDGQWVVHPRPLPHLLQLMRTMEAYRAALRSGVALEHLADGLTSLQQLCDCLPRAIVEERVAAPAAEAGVSEALQQRRRAWRVVLAASRPELRFDDDDRITGGLRLRHGVAWHHVHFAYPQLFSGDGGGVRATLADVCLTCPAVGMTAVIGPSGAGKSSMNVLLRRLYDPVPVVGGCDGDEDCDAASDRAARQREWVDLHQVGGLKDAEEVLVEVLRLAVLESALPPPPASVVTAASGEADLRAAAPAHSQLYRLHTRRGYVALDDLPLSLFHPAYVRQWFGWLPQTPRVQPRHSFLANVRGTRADVSAADARQALHLCRCDIFMEATQRTLYDTVGPLSGGEAQRLALARVVAALLARSRQEMLHSVLVCGTEGCAGGGVDAATPAAVGGLLLDEPTSRLDAANELEVLAALESLQLCASATTADDSTTCERVRLFTWMISHRMSSLRAAAYMVVVERGRVAVCGPAAAVVAVSQFAATQVRLQQLTAAPVSDHPGQVAS
ncbi:ABC transporter family-like protein [Novymonas esmeraldas]|uniref:ABC transporter family-like protein n=1 Tax=Novymonas esmeraldas TaxID=1808958 RepID=A0AAW0F6A2_9TRYP